MPARREPPWSRIAASVEIANLLNEIESSTSRISDLVCAIKEYTYMDQAPVHNVDIVKSLETTLTILNHKLKKGVVVERDYQPAPLLVNLGSELNQVWTNIIDNAIDAMHGTGDLRIRTYQDDSCAVVEIGDTGSGISPTSAPHLRTLLHHQGSRRGHRTRPRHRPAHRKKTSWHDPGNLRPGDTRFQIWLPLAENA